MADRKIDLMVAVALAIAFFGTIIFMYFIHPRLNQPGLFFIFSDLQRKTARVRRGSSV